MKTKIGIGILVIFLMGVGFMIFSSSKNPTYAPKENINPNTSPSGAVADYTLADVKTHDNAQDCWTVVNSNVYDVTSWINKHPGGKEAILYMCGKDASEAFNGKHGGQERPEAMLQSFLIGKLQ